jgi:GNAT superfamily N-acetyltransferase
MFICSHYHNNSIPALAAGSAKITLDNLIIKFMARKPQPNTRPRRSAGLNVILRELAFPSDAAMLFALIKQLNPDITKNAYNQILNSILPLGYRVLGAFKGNKLVGACGIWTASRFWCGKYIEVDNFVVDKNQRNAGIGKRLMDWVEEEAKHAKCQIIMADSYTHNTASHRFYFRENYIIKGFCFVKDIPAERRGPVTQRTSHG